MIVRNRSWKKAAATLAALTLSIGLTAAPAIAATAADSTPTPAPTVTIANPAALGLDVGKLDADPVIRNSTIGYYEYIGAKGAVAWFDAVRSDPQKAQYLKLGDTDSATSLDNALKAALSIKRGNLLRVADNNFPGRSALKVDHTVNAMAQTAADWMNANDDMQHQNWNAMDVGDYYAAGQNIAAGWANPFNAWYLKEKALYDLGVRDPDKVGHYTNLTSSDYTLTGFGWSGIFSAQNFAAPADPSANPGVDVDAYIASLTRYKFLAEHYTGEQPSEPDDGDRVPVYRLYNRYTGMHHYTVDASERDGLVELGWKDEGTSFTVSSNGYPVYRLYNPYDPKGLHHYTMSREEADKMVRDGWKDEGIGWYVPKDGSLPVYRLYNQYSGEHLFTTNFGEYESAAEAGWIQESVAWIAFK